MKINVLNIIFSYDIQVAVNNFECQYNGPELEKLLANNFSSSGQFVDFNPTQSSLDFAHLDFYRSFSSDVTAAILVYQNNEMAAILVYGTGISSFLFKYFVLFHHPTGATDHVSENDLYCTCFCTFYCYSIKTILSSLYKI